MKDSIDDMIDEMAVGFRDMVAAFRREIEELRRTMSDLQSRLDERRLISTPTVIPSVPTKRRLKIATVDCHHCGTSFEQKASRKYTRKYCDDCFRFLAGERLQKSLAKKRNEVPVVKIVSRAG